MGLVSWSPLGRPSYENLHNSLLGLNSQAITLVFGIGTALVIGVLLYLTIDYRQHKAPLRIALPEVKYNLSHHVRVVTIPLVRSRWKSFAYSGFVGLASFTLLGLVIVFGSQRFIQAKNLDITISGSGTSGFVAFTPRPILRGTAPPNSILTITLDGQSAGTTTSTSKGQWSFQPVNNLALGGHNITVNAQESGKYLYSVSYDGVRVINTIEHKITGTIVLPMEASDTSLGNVTLPTKQRLYVLTRGSSNYNSTDYSTGGASIIDTSQGDLIKTVQLPFRPERIIASTNEQRVVVVGKIYNSGGNATGTRVAVIDTTTQELVGQIFETSEDIRMTDRSGTEFGTLSKSQSMYLLHTTTTFVSITMADATVQTIDLLPYETEQSGYQASQVVLTNNQDEVWVRIQGKFVKIDIASQQLVDEIVLAGNPIMSNIKINSDDSAMTFASCDSYGQPLVLRTIDLVGGQLLTPVQVGNNCGGVGDILVNPSGTRAYVANYSNNLVGDIIVVVNLTDRTLEPSISLGPNQQSAYNPLYQSPFDANIGYYAEYTDSYTGGAIKQLNLTTGQTTTIVNQSNKVIRFSAVPDPVIVYHVDESDQIFHDYTYNLTTTEVNEIVAPLEEGVSGAINSQVTATQNSLAEKSIDFSVETVTITDPLPNTQLTSATYTAHGRAPAGYKVELFINDVQKGAAVADQNNNWTYQLTGLTPGAATITAQASADSTGFPIAYLGEEFNVTGYQFYNFAQNQVEIHDDIDFDGRIPQYLSPDGNVALTFSMDSYSQAGLTLYKYDLVTKQTTGSATIGMDVFENCSVFTSADGLKTYFINTSTANKYTELNLTTMQTTTYDLDTNGPFNITTGNVMKKIAQSPDRTKIYIPTGLDSAVDIFDTTTGQITRLNTSKKMLAVDAPSNDFFIVYGGEYQGNPSDGDFYVDTYQIFDAHSYTLLGTYPVTSRYYSRVTADYRADQQKLYLSPAISGAVGDMKVINTNDWTVNRDVTFAKNISNGSGDNTVGITQDGTIAFMVSGSSNLLQRFDTTTGNALSSKEFPGIVREIAPLQESPGKYTFRQGDGNWGIYNSTTNSIESILEIGTIGFVFSSSLLNANSGFLNFKGFVAGRVQVNVQVVLGTETTNPPDPTAPSGGSTGTNSTMPPPRVPTRPVPNMTQNQPVASGNQEPQPLQQQQNQQLLQRRPVGSITELPKTKAVVKKPFIVEPIARAISWFILLVLLFLALLYGRRGYKEYLVRRQLQEQLEHMKTIKQATDSYVSITNHYLNTPVAIMSGALELLVSLKKLPDWATQRLETALKKYGQDVHQLASQSQLELSSPVVTSSTAWSGGGDTSPLMQKAVWLPIVVAGSLFALVTLLFGLTNVYVLASVQTALQVICLVLFAVLLVGFQKYKDVQRASQEIARSAIISQQKLIEERNAFMSRAAETLAGHYENITIISQELHAIPETRTFFNGLHALGQMVESLQKVRLYSAKTVDSPELNLGQEVPRAISKLQAKAAEKQVQLQLDVPASLRVAIQPQELAQIIESLTDNSIMFSKPGGRVTISAQQAGNWVNLRVIDNGTGIDPDHLAHLSEPFYRATSTETFNYEGLGLSLHINRIIAEKLGGRLEVRSSKNGTTVTVRLPALQKSKKLAPLLVAPITANASI